MDAIAALDPHFAVVQPGSDLLWYDASALGSLGQGWPRARLAAPYDRLPASAEAQVRPEVWALSRCAAGIEIRFATDAREISASWTLTRESLAMDHMPATGVSGLDLYLLGERGWRWAGTGRPTRSPTNQVRLVADLPAAGLRTFRLYLPLYNGVSALSLGIPTGAALRPVPAPDALPLVIYGTSIVHGGCASRPGMAYPAQLGRILERPVVNLGFSGNGRAEPELAGLVAEVEAAAYVIDPLPNLSVEQVTERMGAFIALLRAARPGTPIIAVENITYQHQATLRAGLTDCTLKNRALRAILGPHLAADPRLRLVPGETLLGEDGEGTVDGVHPTDLGFARMAAALAPVLRAALRSG